MAWGSKAFGGCKSRHASNWNAREFAHAADGGNTSQYNASEPQYHQQTIQQLQQGTRQPQALVLSKSEFVYLTVGHTEM
jgi:hypothetical protein